MSPNDLIEHAPTITREGGEHVLRACQELPGTPESAFPFFADAGNLERITPAFLHFRIITPQPIPMEVGTRIDYRIRIRGIPVRWRTRISAWEPPFRFVDEQLRGPYRQWIHEHTFTEVDGNTMMEDIVRYRVLGGGLINRLFVENDVLKIFRARAEILRELMPIDSPGLPG